MYIQKAHGFIMVYSVSSAQSIERVVELYNHIVRLAEDRTVCFLKYKILARV